MTRPSAAATITYGYIYSHMRNHMRVTSLITLSPGYDYVLGSRYDSVAAAEAEAERRGIVLVKSGVLDEMVQERRAELATPTVANLTAAVAVYEVPLSPFAPVIPELAHALDFEDALDCIHADAVVTVKLPYMRPFTGNVISVNHEAQQVLVEAWFSAAPPAWYDADVVQLLWTKEAADVALERTEKALEA